MNHQLRAGSIKTLREVQLRQRCKAVRVVMLTGLGHYQIVLEKIKHCSFLPTKAIQIPTQHEDDGGRPGT
jgi:hypothetical protein